VNDELVAALGPAFTRHACPHLAVLLRRLDDLPAMLASFYALGVRREAWIVHHCLPGATGTERVAMTAEGLPVAELEAQRRMIIHELDPREQPPETAARFERALEDALGRGLSALWYSRFPIGPGAQLFEAATAHDANWDRHFRGRPVVTLCPYVVGDGRQATLEGFHDAIAVQSEAGGFELTENDSHLRRLG
jgi:hypothetical protein